MKINMIMFGRNNPLGIERGNGEELKVHNVFYTIQGEGPFIGRVAVFIRLAGCNLACSFCDTDFDDYQIMSVKKIIDEVFMLINDNQQPSAGGKTLIVITGGEPLRQNLYQLCCELLAKNLDVQIETNGTIYQEFPEEVSVVCSPKIVNDRYYFNNKMMEKVLAFKFLISCHLEGYNSVPANIMIPEHKLIYVQPMDEYDEHKNKANIEYTKEISLKFCYRFSMQLHKILNIA